MWAVVVGPAAGRRTKSLARGRSRVGKARRVVRWIDSLLHLPKRRQQDAFFRAVGMGFLASVLRVGPRHGAPRREIDRGVVAFGPAPGPWSCAAAGRPALLGQLQASCSDGSARGDGDGHPRISIVNPHRCVCRWSDGQWDASPCPGGVGVCRKMSLRSTQSCARAFLNRVAGMDLPAAAAGGVTQACLRVPSLFVLWGRRRCKWEPADAPGSSQIWALTLGPNSLALPTPTQRSTGGIGVARRAATHRPPAALRRARSSVKRKK